jgi:dipeptidyl aminopeptidase/acylaminoacyl peptidase
MSLSTEDNMAAFAPYGSWKSPISAELIAGRTIGLGQVALDGQDVYWIEQRPQEAGRNIVIRRLPNGNTEDMTPAPFNARTRVHEYGGGAFAVADGVVYFSNFAEQCVYRHDANGIARLTIPGRLRYADYVVDRRRRRLVCVREDHGGKKPVNTIVFLPLNGEGESHVLASGNDFYSSPRLSPDGSKLAYLTWNHPDMPWDGCELWLAELTEAGIVASAERIAGGTSESIFQPEWSPDGILYFVSDRSGWWNLYRLRKLNAEPVCPTQAEFGGAQWVFGLSAYAFESSRRIVCAYSQEGISRLALIDTKTLDFQPLSIPYTDISFVRAGPGFAIFNTASPTETSAIVRLDLVSGKSEVLRRSSEVTIDPGYLSAPRAIEFPTENGLSAHAFFYLPKNRDFQAPPGEKPPLLVMSHGGPTSSTSSALSLRIQYWASRGIAVLDVNYGGSTGYGRAYRERLNGQWGVVDVDDCVNGARYLVSAGEVNGRCLMIRGASAGGFTTLCALTFRDVFTAGASYYGVSDLEALNADTHKFESHYNVKLIGPYPERVDLYRARSPIYHTDNLSCPIILLQGLEDKVVPPNQAEMMFEAVRTKGLPVAYLTFEGEQHGFRKAENVKRALEAELYFYSQVFGFDLAEPVEPVAIENLPGA